MKTKTRKSGKKDTVAVHCAFTEMLPTAKLTPHPRNPNKHPENQIALLAKIIKAQGWRAPITVSKRSGYVVKGHARLAAALLIGVKTVPVDIQPYPDEAAELADMVADNRIAELAEMDMAALKDLLQELDTGAFDVDLTGYVPEDIEQLMTQFHVPENNKPINEEGMKDTKNTCPKCGFKW